MIGRDATLRELAGLIQSVRPEARSPDRDISFAFVYPDRTGTNVVKHVSTIASGEPTAHNANSPLHAGNTKTLADLKFETGDSLSVALMRAKRNN